MAVALRFGVNNLFNILTSLNGSVARKFCPNCTAVSSGARFYKGSNRDIRRRERNKRMQEIKQQGPRRFDYKQFIRANYDKELSAFTHRFNLSPDNELLRKALTHKSFVDEGDVMEHNGKLAVLGFNVSSQIISSFLFLSYTNFPSYGMRSIQEHLLSQNTLVNVARSLSIPELIQTKFDLNSPEEITEDGLSKSDIIADSFLALIGAIHLHEGSAQAGSFVHDFLVVQLYGEELERIIKFKNPESSLTTLLQQQRKAEPVARLISSSGRHTETPLYVIGVFSSETLLAKVASPILEKAKYEAYCSALTNVLKTRMPQPNDLPYTKT